jgi:SAM-dependent methyltransferase
MAPTTLPVAGLQEGGCRRRGAPAICYKRPMTAAFDLPAGAFHRLDESPDAEFYAAPRFVTHIDDGATAAVTELYREHLRPGAAVLDLMSSWVSHLPPEATYCRVVGLGMNAQELGANPRLDAWVVHDLNADPRLPFARDEFDGAGCCVSIDYLIRPVEVLRDLARVLGPGAPLVITFSNRRFPTKVIALWESLDDAGHMQLVEHYVEAAGGWHEVVALDRSPAAGDPLFAVVARRAPS